jgi:hypothetical protein
MHGVANKPASDAETPLRFSNVRLSKRGEFVTRETTGEAVIVPIRGQIGDLDAIYTFNEVGTFIWNLLDHSMTVSDIVQAVCESFDVTRDQSEADSLEFLRTLQGWGIVKLGGEKD